MLAFNFVFAQNRMDTISISWSSSNSIGGPYYKLSIYKYNGVYNLIKEIRENKPNISNQNLAKEMAEKIAFIKSKQEELKDTSYKSDELRGLISYNPPYEAKIKKSSCLLDSNYCFLLMKEIFVMNKDSVGVSEWSKNYNMCDGDSYVLNYWINGQKHTIYGHEIDYKPELRGYSEFNSVYQKMLKWSKIYKNNKVE